MLLHSETVWFWVDLSANSGLISPNFNSATATPTVVDSQYGNCGAFPLSKILPPAKIGNNNYISVYSINADNNYFIISNIACLDGNGAPHNIQGSYSAALVMTPQQAYAIDSKTDDGLPQSGRVQANYAAWDITYGTGLTWAAGGGNVGAASSAIATPASATTCYDNGNVAGATLQYSVGYNGGNGLNCALSIKFQ